MKRNPEPTLTGFLHQYPEVLDTYLIRRRGANLKAARTLGRTAVALGLETMDIARIHQQALLAIIPAYSPGTHDGVFRRAGRFFAEVVTPIERTHRAAREAYARLKLLNETLRSRAAELALSNKTLRREIAQRKKVEAALRNSEREQRSLLTQSRDLQEQLRRLSHQLLSAQEEERKRISRELHDEIVQMLASINVQLATMKRRAGSEASSAGSITKVQQLVEASIRTVHQFAVDLRPSVLDDLGLNAGLQSYVTALANRTGLRIHLKTFSGIERLDSLKRTVLFRVAQEALTNVVRHAHATRVNMRLERKAGSVHMDIQDDGRAFPAGQSPKRNGSFRLGLIGMRERVEMVGGRLHISSAEGSGTTISVQLPWRARSIKQELLGDTSSISGT